MKVQEKIINGKKYFIGYKVVTEDLKSTGLRGTPVVQFVADNWNVFKEHGVWAARVPSFATYVRSWLKHRYGVATRTFIVGLENIKKITKNGIHAEKFIFLEELYDDKIYDVSKVI